MIIEDQHIKLNTGYDGDFKVTITSIDGTELFSQNMRSKNQQIILKGFTLRKHKVTISPVQYIL